MSKPIFYCGPCVIDDNTYAIAEYLANFEEEYDGQIDFYFKASYDKANRTRHDAYRGPGLSKGLDKLEDVKHDLGLKIITDVHNVVDVVDVACVADVIQIPAFLCRQTDLLEAVAKTGKIVNIKKGQFVEPRDIRYATRKVTNKGNGNVVITERGSCFGYNDLVIDMRGIRWMQGFTGHPVVFDCTHSVQKGEMGGRAMAPILANAAMAAGADGLFAECYFEPDEAKCDAENSIRCDNVKELIDNMLELYEFSHRSR